MTTTKRLLCLALLAASTTANADIQDPPMNDHGPTRKFSRGFANIIGFPGEIINSMDHTNNREGGLAAITYGVVRGSLRGGQRVVTGVYEVFTFPFPTYRRSYRAPYKSNIPWIHSGFDEFAPEVGFQTRRHYTTSSYASW